MTETDPIVRYVVAVYAQPPRTKSIRIVHTTRTTSLQSAVAVAVSRADSTPGVLNATVTSKHKSGASHLVGDARPGKGFVTNHRTEGEPAMIRLASWDTILQLNDNQIDAAYREGRGKAMLPFAESTIKKLTKFEHAYAMYLAGSRKTNPTAKAFGLDAVEARAARENLRGRISKATTRRAKAA